MAADTRTLVGDRAERVESRSLCFERYPNPLAKDDERRAFFGGIIKKRSVNLKADLWSAFLSSMVGQHTGRLLYAQLQSRMMINMAGGVMENVGLCLDRFGLPYLPGSAVKGCARRVALAALHEWCAADGQPGNKPTGTENPFTAICSPFEEPALLLASIARIFGWSEQEWESQSDWAWATGADHRSSIFCKTREVLSRPVPKSYAGAISFLPSHLVDLGQNRTIEGLDRELPDLGQLELEIISCHHPDYYAGKKQFATDTESPIPVTFPAVAPGHIFAFGLIALRGVAPGELDMAKTWLATGLATYGIGAKTNAGYGWFNSSETVDGSVSKALLDLKTKREAARRRAEEELQRQAEEIKKREQAERIKAALANLTPEQVEDFKLQECTDDQFRGRLDTFANRDEGQKRAIVRALRKEPAEVGSRRKFWDDLKKKEQKGGPPAKLAQAIRTLSKQMYPEEGKMP